MNALMLATRGLLRGTTSTLINHPFVGRIGPVGAVRDFDGRLYSPRRLTARQALEILPFWVQAYYQRKVDVRTSDVAPTRDAVTLIYTADPRRLLNLTQEDYRTFLRIFYEDPYRSAFNTFGVLPSQSLQDQWILDCIAQLYTH
jgi:hypothetical protein